MFPLLFKNRRLKVAVLMGGPSSEHEISLASGENVFSFLNPEKYEAEKALIDKSGKWQPEKLKKFDLVFNCLHGEFGEDGRAQRILENLGILYTGSGVMASVFGMDKKFSRFLFQHNGIDTPESPDIKDLKFPVIVKPRSRGSSVGISIVFSKEDLEKAINEALRFDKDFLIEEYLPGREITCAVLEDIALPVTEIIPPSSSSFFDYQAKYSGQTQEITPARIDEDLIREAQEIAKKAHRLLGCYSYSRSDMIISNGKIYLLEINTLPGLTQESLLPKAAAVAGLEFSELLDKIIELAVNKR